jgi:hypothetical protein
MFHNCIGYEQGKFSSLHQISQQESVLGSERDWIKHILCSVQPSNSNCESSRVQVSNAGICLQHEVLKGCKPQLFCPANEAGAVPHEPQLKTIMLG